MPDTDSNALLSPPQRPRAQRQRSSSLPFIQAIEVTATEAAIMFAAEQAAISRRRARLPDRQQRRQQRPQPTDPARAADPVRNVSSSQDEAGDKDNGPSEDLQQQQPSAQPRSNATSTNPPPLASLDPAVPKPRQPSITGLVSEELHALLPLPQNPLNTYSANLTRFIQSRINSIRSAIPAPPLSPSSPCSCPELSQSYLFPDLPSPTDLDGSPGPSGPLNPNPFETINPLIPTDPTDSTDPPNLTNPSTSRIERNLSIALPLPLFPFPPPLRSTFSNWSSTSGCNSPAAWVDEPLPSPPALNGDSIASTPSIPELYASVTSRSGFAGTPLDDPMAEEGAGAGGAGGAGASASAGSAPAPAPTSAPPSAPALASVSASPSPAAAAAPDQPAKPSFLHPSYFSPRHYPQQVLTAISPYEGGALTRVVDVFVQAPNRVVVEGMAFEMVG